MPQAIELVEKVNHPNLGIMFNLCHFLKSEKLEDLETILTKAAPHLFSVSINGADGDGKDWDSLIQTLDKGNFPQLRLLGALKKLHYQGPVCLQCFAVKGDKKTNLKQSIEAWETILKELP
jgi:sugar phosphate isomerase/epimerase